MARKFCTPLLLLATLVACEVSEPVSDAPVATPRNAPDTSCVQHCEAKHSTFRERCLAENDDEALCDDAWSVAFDSCVHKQCGLVVQIPDVAGLRDLAETLAPDLLGPGFDLTDVIPHYYDDEGEIGSRVYRFVSAEDGALAFMEIGATTEMPPIVSYGFGPTAEEAMGEHAVERLSEAYGDLGFSLTRRYFSAAHPILEYETPSGDHYYYAVGSDDVSDVLGVDDDLDADADALAQRREAFLREWDRYLP